MYHLTYTTKTSIFPMHTSVAAKSFTEAVEILQESNKSITNISATKK